jgi:nanoRNase/pAp phosphatase (c-di-AMP/oligoRNAs hydrolase)
MDWKIATALTYGIRIDTDKLARGVSKTDMEMLFRMYDLCDQDIIRMLEHSNLCFEDLIAYSSAISSIEVYDNISFADTGRDCPEALIANVSDFMLAIREVSFSVVYSRRENGIKISVRSEFDKLDAGKITAQALDGIGNGGGHPQMAGGFVPFEGTEREEVILTDQIKERFSAAVGAAQAAADDNIA